VQSTDGRAAQVCLSFYLGMIARGTTGKFCGEARTLCCVRRWP
jgi:hypothetical protein